MAKLVDTRRMITEHYVNLELAKEMKMELERIESRGIEGPMPQPKVLHLPGKEQQYYAYPCKVEIAVAHKQKVRVVQFPDFALGDDNMTFEVLDEADIVAALDCMIELFTLAGRELPEPSEATEGLRLVISSIEKGTK